MRRLGGAEWAKLIAEYESSEISQKEFVAKHDVSLATFQFHLYKLRKRASTPNSESPAAFLPIEVVASPAPQARKAIDGVEVALRSGVVVRFEVGTELHYLSALFAALG
jgi:hypothetical protein